jgi:hypothetical protein
MHRLHHFPSRNMPDAGVVSDRRLDALEDARLPGIDDLERIRSSRPMVFIVRYTEYVPDPAPQ